MVDWSHAIRNLPSSTSFSQTLTAVSACSRSWGETMTTGLGSGWDTATDCGRGATADSFGREAGCASATEATGWATSEEGRLFINLKATNPTIASAAAAPAIGNTILRE